MAVAGFEKGIKEIEVLQKALGISDYREFCNTINRLVEEGKLIPTKGGRDTNGKLPPLAKKYRIVEVKKNYDKAELLTEIQNKFPLKYKRNYYKNHLDQYQMDRIYIMMMCSYHNRKDLPLKDAMSYNERLYDIFNHEKSVFTTPLQTILNRLGLDEDYLNFYKTPEPFIYYSSNENEKQKILIVENKDTWYTLRRLLQEGYEGFDSIIYGEGKKILSSIEELKEHQKSYFRNTENSYRYFGDLDDEGLNIFLSLADRVPEINIKLWQEGYDKMLELAEKNNRWRVYKPQRSIGEEKISKLFPDWDYERINRVVSRFLENEYIPQEILNYQVLKNMLKKKRG
jgi:hypothetical protein